MAQKFIVVDVSTGQESADVINDNCTELYAKDAAQDIIIGQNTAAAATADGKAVAAQSTADTALTNAAAADGKADTAQGTANAAESKSNDNESDLLAIKNIVNQSISETIYTLDVDNKQVKNFKIESTDATAKSIVLSNVNALDSLISVAVLLISTTACAITHPAGTTFVDGIPTFTTGESNWILYESVDGGTTWAGYSRRRS